MGEDKIIAFDVGGTTAKMSVVEDGTPTLTHRFEAGRLDKFKPGSGLPLRLTVVDMIEIGAGGGSIAGLDDLGLLKVGPRSAGSDPGPVAYGPGGTMPTVTDADLVSGRLDPDHFPGGEMSLVGADVRAALKSHVAEPLGIDVTEAAVGIQNIAADSMAAARGRALRRHGGTRQGAPGRRRRVRRQDRHQPFGRYAVRRPGLRDRGPAARRGVRTRCRRGDPRPVPGGLRLHLRQDDRRRAARGDQLADDRDAARLATSTWPTGPPRARRCAAPGGSISRGTATWRPPLTTATRYPRNGDRGSRRRRGAGDVLRLRTGGAHHRRRAMTPGRQARLTDRRMALGYDQPIYHVP
ncbi:hypothetical protein K8Z49_08665 [Actinomadura madurae]